MKAVRIHRFGGPEVLQLDEIDPPVAADGKLLMPSPVDATLLPVQEHLTPADGLVEQVYRFCDPSGQLALYLLFQAGGTSPVLYIPIMNTAFATDGRLTGAQIMASLLSYYAVHADRAATSPEPALPAATAPEESEHDGIVPKTVSSDTDAPDAAKADLVMPPPAAQPVASSPTPTRSQPPDASKPAAGVTPAGNTRTAYAEEAPEPSAAPSQPNWWKRLFGLGSP